MFKLSHLVFHFDFIWDESDRYLHVFGFIHRSVEVEILHICCHEFRPCWWYHTVEEEIYGCQPCGFGWNLSLLIWPISPHSDSGSFLLLFLWPVITYESCVCDFLVVQDLMLLDELHGLCALDPPFKSFISLPNSLDENFYHTYLVSGSAMRCLYSIIFPVIGFRMAFMYCCVALSNKWYTRPWFGFTIVFVSSLTMIACINNDLDRVGYLCVLGRRRYRSVSIAGLISSHTSSTLEASAAWQVFTGVGVIWWCKCGVSYGCIGEDIRELFECSGGVINQMCIG